MNLALFDLDNTLLPIDSDNEWGKYLVRIGAVDADAFSVANARFFAQYQAGTLDPHEYLTFSLGTLARFPRQRLDQLHAQFMRDVIEPAILPVACDLLQKHREAGDLVAIVTATNRYVTRPIATAFGVEHLLAAIPEETADGQITGKLKGPHSQGKGKIDHTASWLAAMGKTLASFNKSYFYSDSHNDIPLMSIVTDPVATNPNTTLAAHAKAHGWPLLKIFND
jgi:HAD superfamily hydrolase (TIGR01490 family)